MKVSQLISVAKVKLETARVRYEEALRADGIWCEEHSGDTNNALYMEAYDAQCAFAIAEAEYGVATSTTPKEKAAAEANLAALRLDFYGEKQ